ncbi:hypothetical protein H6F89_30760 [Cyanobacteria bacterium FACHB-63]|nr:hypothetical protein [Cyanobacteria bacterium FACHB-63]
MKHFSQYSRIGSLLFLWLVMSPMSAQAEPAPLFRSVLENIQRQLPNGLQMRLPSYLPEAALTLHPFVQSNSKGLQLYLSSEANCNQPKCSVGGLAAFTQEGFSPWARQLKKGTPVSLPDGIQGYYLIVGKGKTADHYVLWQQDGVGFVLGTDRGSLSQQELIQIAASTVVEPPLRKSEQTGNVLIPAQPSVTEPSSVTRPLPQPVDIVPSQEYIQGEPY